jgi:hypothetical protein
MDVELINAHKKYQEKLDQSEKIRMDYATKLVRYVNNRCDRLNLTNLKKKMISKTEKGEHKCHLFDVPMVSINPKWKHESWTSFVKALENINIGAILSRKLELQGLRVSIGRGFTFFLSEAAVIELRWDPLNISGKQPLLA